MTFVCPKSSVQSNNCDFKTQTLSQMNTHLRKHTKYVEQQTLIEFIMHFFPLRTYKCGHCGKTHLDNAEFHRHSALTHGDKIPDLVKDPEVRLMRQQINNLDLCGSLG